MRAWCSVLAGQGSDERNKSRGAESSRTWFQGCGFVQILGYIAVQVKQVHLPPHHLLIEMLSHKS